MPTNNLTPYDLGTRLEPQLWPTGSDPESFGRVDFDNDESATVFTAYVEKEGEGYVLHLEGVSTPLRVVANGVVVNERID